MYFDNGTKKLKKWTNEASFKMINLTPVLCWNILQPSTLYLVKNCSRYPNRAWKSPIFMKASLHILLNRLCTVSICIQCKVPFWIDDRTQLSYSSRIVKENVKFIFFKLHINVTKKKCKKTRKWEMNSLIPNGTGLECIL